MKPVSEFRYALNEKRINRQLPAGTVVRRTGRTFPRTTGMPARHVVVPEGQTKEYCEPWEALTLIREPVVARPRGAQAPRRVGGANGPAGTPIRLVSRPGADGIGSIVPTPESIPVDLVWVRMPCGSVAAVPSSLLRFA